jgi:hypothetical protein
MTTGDEYFGKSDLSCTFCGPGTWATWEVVTDDGVVFSCDRHHVDLSEAKLIRLERMRGKKTWHKIPRKREILFEEENLDDFTNIEE